MKAALIDSPPPAETVLELVTAAIHGDRAGLRRAASELARRYDGPDRSYLQHRVRELLQHAGASMPTERVGGPAPVDAKTRQSLLELRAWPTDPLVLDGEAESALNTAYEEFAAARRLAAAGLPARNALMLSGPPGTGKSHIAGHLAMRLGRPLLTIRLDSVISSLLGDTAKNVRALFEHARGSEAVIFLDEFDAIAKQRDDARDLGEVKRVVNTVLQGLDILTEQAVVVAATNHPHLLDRAVWRRFPHHIALLPPGQPAREDLWRTYLALTAEEASPKGRRNRVAPVNALLATISEGLTGSDIRELAIAARRLAVLEDAPVDHARLAYVTLASEPGRIVRPSSRALPDQDTLAASLNERGLSGADIGRLLGVTRQGVYARLNKKDSSSASTR